MKDQKNVVRISNWFVGPRNWSADSAAPRITVDGERVNWEIDGADEGIVFSDSTVNNQATLSPKALAKIASGERLVIGGKTSRGRARDAVIDIAGSQNVFDEFDARCRKLSPA